MLPVISNAGPLIALAKVSQLHLLADLYAEVLIPDAVFDEVVTQGLTRGDIDALVTRLFLSQHSWPILQVSDVQLTAFEPQVMLGKGETAVIALGLTVPGCLLLLDDAIAREEAQRLGFRVKGTLGILAEAYRSQRIGRAQLELVVREIGARPDIWISAQLCSRVLAALLG